MATLRLMRYGLLSVAVLMALLLGLVVLIATRFDPNDYKPGIIRLVQEKKQRTLTIPGQIHLQFFPRLGADLGQVSLSEHGSGQQFAAVERVQVALELLPLLHKKVVISQVVIDGIDAHLVRYPDGKLNIDDLLSKEQDDASQVELDIDSVYVNQGKLVFDDQQQKRRIGINKLNLKSGRIAVGVPSSMDVALDLSIDAPKVESHVGLKTSFTIDPGKSLYQLENIAFNASGKALDWTDLDIRLAGAMDYQPSKLHIDSFSMLAQGRRGKDQLEWKCQVPQLLVAEQDTRGEKVSASGTWRSGTRQVVATLDLPVFKGNMGQLTMPDLLLQAGITDGNLDAKVKLGTSLNVNLTKWALWAPAIQLSLNGKQGDVNIAGQFAAKLDADPASVHLNAMTGSMILPNPHGGSLAASADGQLSWQKGRLDSHIKATLDQQTHLDAQIGLLPAPHPAWEVKLLVDQIDLNRYQSVAKTTAPAASKAATLDLSALKDLHGRAHLELGQLTVADLKLAHLRADARADGKQLEVNGLSANLYGGKTEGAWTITASERPRMGIKQSFSGVSLGPLLQDAIKKAPLDGKAQLTLDLQAEGAQVAELKQSLNGNLKLSVQDGAVRGFNLAQIVRTAKGGSGASSTGTAGSDDKTDFSELSASFQLRQGVAHNDDLSAKSPLFRVVGNGDINLVQEQVNYLVKPTIVASLQGQGGPELQALKGVTIPVRLTGPWTQIGWKVDVANMVTEGVKDKAKNKLQELLKDKLPGLFK